MLLRVDAMPGGAHLGFQEHSDVHHVCANPIFLLRGRHHEEGRRLQNVMLKGLVGNGCIYVQVSLPTNHITQDAGHVAPRGQFDFDFSPRVWINLSL